MIICENHNKCEIGHPIHEAAQVREYHIYDKFFYFIVACLFFYFVIIV